MIKVMIVDDEPLARDVITEHLSKMPNFELVAKCGNAIEAFEALHKNDIDLMFLDIQMPQISGIDFLRTLSNPPKTIFTTAYSEYAVDSYELENIVDYLMKPISFERFNKAIQKAKVLFTPETPKTEALQPEAETVDYIYVKSDKKLIKILFNDIFYIEGLKDYVILHTPKKRIVTLQTMKNLAQKLSEYNFVRIHRSYIINIKHIQQIEGNTVLINQKSIPIGKNYKSALQEIIASNKL